MNEDGRDEPGSARGDPSSTDGTKTFPNAMLLRLFGLDGEPLESELVPFAQSYEEAILLSRAAFPKQLGSDNDDLTITLKYPCRSYDASIVWAGLRVTKDNPDTWRRLLSKNSEVIELRVLMGDIDQDTETVERPLTGLDGIPLKLHFHRASGTSWTVAADPVPAPATYRGCVRQALAIVERLGLPDHPGRTADQVAKGLRLGVYDVNKFVSFERHEYVAYVKKVAKSNNSVSILISYHP